MELVIRPCVDEDFGSIYELLKQLWPAMKLDFKQLQNVFRIGITSDKQKFIVGILDKKIVGFCSLTIKNNFWQAGSLAHIDELIVDEKYRGKGIGNKLMEKITEIAAENKCKRIELDSAFHREDAHRFYEKLGFENRAYLFSKKLV